jgi:hypothetical protein
VQYSIVTSDFTGASFIFVTLGVRDNDVEAEVFHQDARSLSARLPVTAKLSCAKIPV